MASSDLIDNTYSEDKDGNPSYTLIWRVEIDDPTPLTAAKTAKQVTGVNRGDILDGVPCLTIDATKNSDDGRQFLVTAVFGVPDEEDDPLDEPAEIKWSLDADSKIVEYDIFGRAILNSAGDPFSDPVEIDDMRPVLSVSRNEPSFNYSLAYSYKDAVNADFFFGAPPGTVKVANIGSTRKFKENYGYYYTNEYTFHFNPQGWDVILLDQGFREKVSGKKKNIEVQGKEVTEAHLLNGQGAKLPEGGNPQYGRWRVYPRLPFSGVFSF